MKIYNTLVRGKQEFVPLEAGHVKIYTCGQTVYNDIHMGNARFYVMFDIVRRYLEFKGFTVNFVQNFTDIDDKIIARAAEKGVDAMEIAELYIGRTLEDLAALNVRRATVNPRATEEIAEIITLIEELFAAGVAYERDGTVYFRVGDFSEYGKLSRKRVEDLISGARIEVEAGKENPADFVLWKPAKSDEPAWKSPWGAGRPGWHIECSAMARKYLGTTIDIHGGAEDLIFPHHENEIAQSEAAAGAEFARYWMHCGILTVDHKKMSKSRGNFATLREVAEKWPYDVLRFYFASGHYRSPMEFTDEAVSAAAAGLTRIKNCMANLKFAENAAADTRRTSDEEKLLTAARVYREGFIRAMDDDFNTADAVTAIFEMVKFVNTEGKSGSSASLLRALRIEIESLLDILGVSLRTVPAPLSGEALSGSSERLEAGDDEIEGLIEQRAAARASRDFAEADRIRGVLAEMGITVEDMPGGVRWKRA